LVRTVAQALRRNPVTAIVGPRQCGKTTLAKQVVRTRGRVHYLDLEDPAVVRSLEHPMTLLRELRGLVVIDEIQRRPDLFPVLRVLADRAPLPARFLILGSASPELLRQSSESLAGRVEYVEMGGFDLTEIGSDAWQRLWWRGGFPRSCLAASDGDSVAWREQFIRTFLERDLPQLGFNLPALTLHRFWTMVAHYHGQVWNSAEVGASLGVTDVTTRRYLDVLAGAYMVRLLPPWHENLAKRQRRTPKIYLRDTGLLHALLGVTSRAALWKHPKCGLSWESFALEHVVRVLSARDAYYWAVHSGPELDLLVVQRGRRLGFEFKLSDAPVLTASMRTALEALRLDHLCVLYPGDRRYRLAARAEVVPLRDWIRTAGQPARRPSNGNG
jgi:hypothetical protein